MHFFAYIGQTRDLERWSDTVCRHAAWLGANAHEQLRHLADGRAFSFGWLGAKPPDPTLIDETAERLTITTLPWLTMPRGPLVVPRNFETNATRLEMSLLDGTVRIAVPMVTTEQLYYAPDAHGVAFSNDMRLLIRWAGLELDEAAAYGLFQYECLPHTLSISRTVHRVPGGFVATFSPAAADPLVAPAFEPPAEPHGEVDAGRSPVERFADAMDGVLARVPKHAVVPFSGGADSGLFAVRLAKMGRTDVSLLNFALSEEDPESQFAMTMAQHLGLRCERVIWQPPAIADFLEDVAREYTVPFSDRAAIPTVLLVRSLSRMGSDPPALLEGSGPAMGYGMVSQYQEWARLYSIPAPVRHLGGWTWRALGLWRSEARPNRVAAAMQRTTQFPAIRAFNCHEPLNGVAYEITRQARGRMESSVFDGVDALTAPMAPQRRASIFGLRHTSTALSALKWFDPLHRRAILPVIPFLEPDMLQLSFALTWEQKCPGGQPKALAKQLMAQRLPSEWVYRRKRVFELPFGNVFANALMGEMMRDVVLSPHNPLLALCRAEVVREIAARAQTGQSLGRGARRFLWTLAFASLWLKQALAGF